ncbi:MAG TPA: hypothetical protein VJA26_08005 [Gammaproteobacteria bacterium]|nr:hypothetical protein [Gammaproteobacteria bacterium]
MRSDHTPELSMENALPVPRPLNHSYAEVFANWPQPGMTAAPRFITRAEAAKG